MKVAQEVFGYKFKNPSLLEEALTHPSFKRVNNQEYDYNRLEFLGDSVVNLIIAEILFEMHPNLAEGELSILHAKLVSRDTFAEIAVANGLSDLILMDTGEEKNNGRENKNNLEDAFEAVCAAIFLDSDYNHTKKLIKELFASHLANPSIEKNHKSALQEWLHQNRGITPRYILTKQTGKAHTPNFTVEVELYDGLKFTATARTKKSAEFLAAKQALEHIEILEEKND